MEEEHKFCRRKFQIFGLLQPTKIVPHRITHPEGCNKIVNIFFSEAQNCFTVSQANNWKRVVIFFFRPERVSPPPKKRNHRNPLDVTISLMNRFHDCHKWNQLDSFWGQGLANFSLKKMSLSTHHFHRIWAHHRRRSMWPSAAARAAEWTSISWQVPCCFRRLVNQNPQIIRHKEEPLL